MKVSDWMSPDPVAVEPELSVRQARRVLASYGIRHLPIVRGDRLVGIISDRDVRLEESALERIASVGRVGDEAGDGVTVADVMSTSVHVIGPDEPIEAAARLMLSRRISALPVVDADGGLIGVVTTTDCLLASLAPVGPSA